MCTVIIVAVLVALFVIQTVRLAYYQDFFSRKQKCPDCGKCACDD